MKLGEGEDLEVLGTRVRFLCTADKTDHAWSLMEVTIPKHAGPPAHNHPRDEPYYVTHGQVRFSVAGKDQIVNAGDFL
jgi:quercetin dioxygenase-like cupin family protein